MACKHQKLGCVLNCNSQTGSILNALTSPTSTLGQGITGLFGGLFGSPEYTVDPFGYGIGSGGMGTVDTSLYGGAYGPSIR